MYKNMINSYYKNSLNILFYLFPLTYLFGSLIINLFTLLVIVIGSLAYKSKIFNLKKDKVIIFFVVFFIYIFGTTVFNYYNYSTSIEVIKSVLYLRYLLLMLIINCMIKHADLNFKFFFCSSLFFSLLLSVDITYQFFNDGLNILNFKAPSSVHNTSIFQEDRIAGSYIRVFSSLSLLSIPFFFKNNSKLLFYVLPIAIIITGLGVFFSGNRMPLILFFAFCFLVILFVKKYRYNFLVGALSLIILISSVLKFTGTDTPTSDSYYNYYTGFVSSGLKLLPTIKESFKTKFTDLEKGTNYVEEYLSGRNTKYELKMMYNGHAHVYTTALDVWKLNPIFGNGIKSFRVRCLDIIYLPNRVCQSHPHNYYLEIMTDLGILGMIILFISIFMLLKENLKKKLLIDKEIYLIFLFFLIVEFIPMRSSGSFFSTYSSTLIFLILGILAGCKSKYQKNEYKIY